MSRLIISVAFLALAFGCSGRDKTTETPQPPSRDGGDGGTTSGSNGNHQPPDPGKPLTEEECRGLTKHVVSIGMRESQAQKPEADRLSEAKYKAVVEEVFEDMATNPDWMGRCKQQPRWAHECAMAANTTQAIAACEAN